MCLILPNLEVCTPTHTTDTYSGFQWATALSSEKAESVITRLLEVMANKVQIKTDNGPACLQ